MAEMDTDDQRVTASQVGAGLASLAEAWVRDTAFCGVGLLSFVVVVAGFADSGTGTAAAGGVAGVVAFALPLYAVLRRRAASRVWLAILAGVVLDALALLLITT
jgi:hypothetical protein